MTLSLELLQKGLKYNIHVKPKHWIKTLALEAEVAVSLLPTIDKEPIRYQIAKRIDKIAAESQKLTYRKTSSTTIAQKEMRIIK
jgi:hypothetical protein